jgi:histidine triad (HIT) family protein
MSSACLFCRILKGEIPSHKVYEDESVYAFKDIAPMAREHYLFIHKNHSQNINEMAQNAAQITDVFLAIKSFTESTALSTAGFRVVTNQGAQAGQTVFHTHFHILGGEQLKGFGA